MFRVGTTGRAIFIAIVVTSNPVIVGTGAVISP